MTGWQEAEFDQVLWPRGLLPAARSGTTPLPRTTPLPGTTPFLSSAPASAKAAAQSGRFSLGTSVPEISSSDLDLGQPQIARKITHKHVTEGRGYFGLLSALSYFECEPSSPFWKRIVKTLKTQGKEAASDLGWLFLFFVFCFVFNVLCSEKKKKVVSEEKLKRSDISLNTF